MSKKRVLKKLYGIIPFYTDSSKRFEFYYRKNWMDQFDILVFDTAQNTSRWFMVTAPVFFTMVSIEEYDKFSVFKDNIDKSAKPSVALELVRNNGFSLIAHKSAKFNAETVVAKVGEFGPEESRERVLLLKRIASVPEANNMILGMDTIEIPFEGIHKFVADVKKKYFKDVDIKAEMEEEDATDSN